MYSLLKMENFQFKPPIWNYARRQIESSPHLSKNQKCFKTTTYLEVQDYNPGYYPLTKYPEPLGRYRCTLARLPPKYQKTASRKKTQRKIAKTPLDQQRHLSHQSKPTGVDVWTLPFHVEEFLVVLFSINQRHPKPSMVCWLFTPPETNSKFTPENGWLVQMKFPFGDDLFSGAFAVSFTECTYTYLPKYR